MAPAIADGKGDSLPIAAAKANRQIGNKMPLKITKNERFYDLKSFEIVHQTCQISQFFEISHKNACYFSSTNFTVLKQA